MKRSAHKNNQQETISRNKARQLVLDIESLRFRLSEAEETIEAIRSGQVDALVVHTPSGDKVFTLKGVDYTYRVIVEQMNEGTITVSREGIILYSNKQFAKLVNAPLEQVIGSSLYKYIHEKDQPEITQHLNRKFKNKHIREVNIKTIEGINIPADLSLSSLERFDIPAISIIVNDLSKQKEAEKLRKALLQLEVIFHNISEAISVYDNKEQIIYANQQAANLLGFQSSKQIINKTCAEIAQRLHLIDKNGETIPLHKLPAIKSKKEISETFKYKNIANGNTGWIAINVLPVLDEKGHVRFTIIVLHDITKQKAVEEQKDAFIGIASHELKTPITTMKAFAQILRKRFAEKGDKKDTYLLKNINEQADRLTNLVNDLLSVSRIESGRLSLKLLPFDLNKLVAKVINDFQFINEIHMIYKEGRLNEDVIGDMNSIEEVLVNLLNNAAKYSPGAKKIIITVKKEKNMATVSVKDFGYGISLKDRNEIFKRFYRSEDKEKNKVSGFGLGLYISSEIIRRHNGKIGVISKPGNGSTFYFSLPLSRK